MSANDDFDADAEPATAAQIEKIKKLSALALNRESVAYHKSLAPEKLTKDEADEVVSDLRLEQTQAKDDAWSEKQQAKEEAEGNYMVVENAVNDEDKRELLHYKKLNSAQVIAVIDYLNANVPNWKKLDKYELASFVRVLFPNQVKATGGRAASEATKFQRDLVRQVAARSAPSPAPKPAPPVAMQPPTPVQAQPPEGYGTKWKPLPSEPVGRGCLVLLAPLLALGITVGAIWLS